MRQLAGGEAKSISLLGSPKLRLALRASSWNDGRPYQIPADVAAIEFLIRLADAADMPAIRATCRTPLPADRAILAFSTLTDPSGGRPNLILRLRAAA